MGRKGTLATTITMIVVLSAGLAGGQVGVGNDTGSTFLWWGDHEPIYIYGDDDFTVSNGVMSGSGTPEDPYVIEGWRIDAPRADYGIYVDHTSKHFVIRDCVIERARIAGVYLNTVSNGVVEETQIGLSDTAIQFLSSDGNTVRRCAIFSCRYGVVMAGVSSMNTISENSFLDCGLNAQDTMRRNAWCSEGRGNYWSDFSGSVDRDGDGIYDTPNHRDQDPCPLVSPPVEWAGVTSTGPSNAGNWIAPDGSLVVTSETPIGLTAADAGAGLAEIRYSIDCGDWLTYTGEIFLTGEDGPKRLDYYGIDNLGNVERQTTVFFFLDNHPPVTVHEIGEPLYVTEEATWVTTKTPIILRRAQESTYGRARTFFRIDGRNWQEYCGPFVLHAADGPHQISYYSRNASGVTEEIRSFILYKDDLPPNTRGGRGTIESSLEVNVGTPDERSPTPEPTLEPVAPEPPDEGTADATPDSQLQTPSDVLDAGPGIEDDAGEPAVQTP